MGVVFSRELDSDKVRMDLTCMNKQSTAQICMKVPNSRGWYVVLCLHAKEYVVPEVPELPDNPYCNWQESVGLHMGYLVKI